MPSLLPRLRLLLLLAALGASHGGEGTQPARCFQVLATEAGALNIGQRWGDPSPTATMSIDLRNVTRAVSTFEFRTFDPEGVIFYGDTNPRVHWFVLGLRGGELEMQINNNLTRLNASSSRGQPVNDGQWHQIMVKNEGDSVILGLDGSDLMTLRQVSYPVVGHFFPEMRIGVGGLLIPEQDLLIPINTALDGCLRRWNWLNTSSEWKEGPSLRGEGTKACFATIRRGGFFPGDGLVSFLLSGLPPRLGLANDSWSLLVEMGLSAGPQEGMLLAISPLEQAPVLSLKVQYTDLVAQLGNETVLRSPLPASGCQDLSLQLRVTSAQLTLRLGSVETSEHIQEPDLAALQRLWPSPDGRLFVGGFPGPGEGGFFRGCLREIRVQGHQLDLDSAQYRSNTIWAYSCPGSESVGPGNNSSTSNGN